MKKSIQLLLVLALVLMGATTATAGKKGHKSSGKTSSKAKITQVIAQVQKYNWEWDENNSTSQKEAWFQGMNKIVFAYYKAKHNKAGDGSYDMLNSVKEDMDDYRDYNCSTYDWEMRESAGLSNIFTVYIEMYLTKNCPTGLSSSLTQAIQEERDAWHDFNEVFKTIYLNMCQYEVAGGSYADLFSSGGSASLRELRIEDLDRQNKVFSGDDISESRSQKNDYKSPKVAPAKNKKKDADLPRLTDGTDPQPKSKTNHTVEDFISDMNNCISLYNKKYPSYEEKDYKRIYDEICEANKKLEYVLLKWYDARQDVIKALDNNMSAKDYENCTKSFLKNLMKECMTTLESDN